MADICTKSAGSKMLYKFTLRKQNESIIKKNVLCTVEQKKR